jgi:putative nucleotidyltransferase with HDIG domain
MEEFFHLCNAVKEAQLDQVLYDYSHTSVNLSQTSLSLHLLKRCRDNSIPRPHGRGFKYGSLKIPEEKSNMIAVLNKGQMKEIVSFAETRHKSGDLNHTMDHIHLTVDLSRYLASKENANSEVCIAAAYLHDIAKGDAAEEPKGDFAKLKKRSDGHGPNGAEEAKEFLKRLDAPDSFIEQVHYAISQHDNDLPKKTIEAKVLWDADKLQLVGPLGLARMFGYYMGYVKKDVYYAIEQARYWQDFFLERFCTETGYQLAGNLQQFMEQFFRLFEGAKNGQLYQPPLRQDLPHSKEHCHAHNIYHPAEDKRL